MKQSVEHGQWRKACRKLKAANKNKIRLEKKLANIPVRHKNVQKEIEEELADLKITISTLELRESRLKDLVMPNE